MEDALNGRHVPSFATVATQGTGVLDALKTITLSVLNDVRQKHQLDDEPAASSAPPEREDETPVMALPGDVATPAVPVSSLADIVGFLEDLVDAEEKRGGPDTVRPEAPVRSLSGLSSNKAMQNQIMAMEHSIDRGDWLGTVEQASALFHGIAARATKNLATGHPDEGVAIVALLGAIPASRYLRFRELEARAQEQEKASLEDALFALFFATDLVLRLES
jgi:hypothetical protein